MNNIFDTHAHYASRQFDGDRAALLTALPEGGWNWRTPRRISTPHWASTRKA